MTCSVFKSELNDEQSLAVDCISGLTEPNPIYPMVWLDTSTGLVKRKASANMDWEIMPIPSSECLER